MTASTSQFRIGRFAPRSRALLAVAACGIALAGALAAGGGATAAAATSPWSVQQVPPVDTLTPNAQFSDVSCPTASTCMAVGRYVGTDGIARTFSERWDRDHGGWHIVLPVNRAGAESSGLDSVACASANSCQAIGGSKGGLLAETWNGKSWRTAPIQATGGDFFDIAMSCATASSCFAVGSKVAKGNAQQAVTEHWNGHRWSLVTPRRPRKVTNLTGVSCPGPRNCYAVGSSSTSILATSRVLVEHWNGSRWSTVSVARPTGSATLNAVSCPTTTSCTAVGVVGRNVTRMLVEDLSEGKWTEGLPAVPKPAGNGTSDMYAVSCSAPRVCTALMSYINQGDELTWAIEGRGAKGGFTVTIPATDVATDTAANVSCHKGGCTIAGGLDTNSGRGGTDGTGTTLALRGSGSHFTQQTTLNPPGTADADLASVSCVASGFCAAATESGQNQVLQTGDPAVMVRMTAHGPWRVAKNSGSGFLAGISCTSATFCLAVGSPAGAETWNGASWSELTAPVPFEPGSGGLQGVSCVSSTACMAVGSTKTHAGLTSQALTAFWNGTSWKTITPIRPAGARWSQLTAVSCTSATHCVAAGYYPPTVTGTPRALVETWNGTKWTKNAPNIRVNFPRHVGVSCANPSACMVTWGDFGEAQAQWWNGTKWISTTFAGPKPRSQERSISGVSCTSATSCTAAGGFVYSTGSGPLVESWNGSKWTVTGAPNPAIGIGDFNGVSCTGVRCTAVGGIQRTEKVPFAEVRG